jgi:hypothetical protein
LSELEAALRQDVPAGKRQQVQIWDVRPVGVLDDLITVPEDQPWDLLELRRRSPPVVRGQMIHQVEKGQLALALDREIEGV